MEGAIHVAARIDQKEPAAAKAAGLNYVRIGMTTRIVPTPDQLKQFLAIVNDPAQQPVSRAAFDKTFDVVRRAYRSLNAEDRPYNQLRWEVGRRGPDWRMRP